MKSSMETCRKKRKINVGQFDLYEFSPLVLYCSKSSWCRVGFTACLMVGGLLFVKLYKNKK